MAQRSIYGVHEGPLDWLSDVAGWVVLTVHAWQVDRVNARAITDAGHVPIVRLNNGYWPEGTLPHMGKYEAFADRLGLIAGNSPDVHHWIVGNEPNHEQEWPDGVSIYPEQYAACFLMCYAAIKQAHPDHLVLAAPIAPYNAETGDCLIYLGRVAQRLASAGAVDGWAIHAYTRAHDSALITREEIVNGWQWHFRTYRDQAAVLGKHALDVPLFLTELNPTDGWQNVDNGYIGEALCEIDAWNQANPRQVIRACCAFRWHDPSRPEWTIRDKSGVVADYCRAADVGYVWDTWDNDDEEEPMAFTNGSFEGTYVAHPGHDNILVAPGWHAWWSDKKWPDQDQNVNRPLAAPEYKPILASEYPYRVLEGTACQCWFVYSKLMNAGLYQQVQVGAGKRVAFSLPFHTWCSAKNDPHVSDGELYLRVGIDERGGTDWEAPSIVWGNWVRGDAEYASTSISTISETDEVTLWIHTWNKWAVPHNDVYVDGATLEIEGDEPGPPEPPPSGVLRVELSGTVRLEMPSLVERVKALFR